MFRISFNKNFLFFSLSRRQLNNLLIQPYRLLLFKLYFTLQSTQFNKLHYRMCDHNIMP